MDGQKYLAADPDDALKLDFSGLFSQEDTQETAGGAEGAEKRTNAPVGGDGNKTPCGGSGAFEKEQVRELYIEAKKEEAHEAEVNRIYHEYQENTKRSMGLQAEILKGVRAGDDMIHLFLKAVEAVSLMTGNGALLRQVRDDCNTIYGDILGDPVVLKDQLAENEFHLEKLRAAASTEKDMDSRNRISRIIQAHEDRGRELQERIASYQK